MGKRISVDLGVIRFTSLKAATEHFSAMLARYRPGDIVNAAESLQLKELLKRHPDYLAKRGVGIAHFKVIDADFGTQCFAVVRTDQSFEDFSFHTCVTEGRY